MSQHATRETIKRVPTLEPLPPRCHDCAFSPGTEASECAITLLRTKLCLEAVEPFLCHIEGREGVMCIGYAQALIERSRKGYYDSQQAWKRELCRDLLQLTDDVEHGKVKDEDVPTVVAQIIEQLGLGTQKDLSQSQDV